MKKVKMLLFSEPGTGKSVFAYLLGNELQKMEGTKKGAFFITTDGNYEWLEDFGAKDEDHIQVNSYIEMQKAFQQPYDDYGTIVVDLVEDAFKWCEQEFVRSQGVTHVSDLPYGKGYDIPRTTFQVDLTKFLGKSKHIILLSHETSKTFKDRRGIEHTSYTPSSKIPGVVLDTIEGRLRYVLRCYMKNEDVDSDNGNQITISKRYLSLVPKEDEFGIIRGVNTNIVPQDIPLDAQTFCNIIYNDAYAVKLDTGAGTVIQHASVGLNSNPATAPAPSKSKPAVKSTPKPKSKPTPATPAVAPQPAVTSQPTTTVENSKPVEQPTPEPLKQVNINLLNKVKQAQESTPDEWEEDLPFDTTGVQTQIDTKPISTQTPTPVPAPATTEAPFVSTGDPKKDALKARIAKMMAEKAEKEAKQNA